MDAIQPTGPGAGAPVGGPLPPQWQQSGAVASMIAKILGGLLANYSSALAKILPKLRYHEDLAEWWSAIGQLLTGGSIEPGTPWKDQPGTALANQETMGRFYYAWLFFLAATGGKKPEGVPEKDWKAMQKEAKYEKIPQAELDDMKKILNDPKFQALAKDVIKNAKLYSEQQGIEAKRRGLFSGADRKTYDSYMQKIAELEQELWDINPNSKDPNDIKRRKELQRKIDGYKTKLHDLAIKDGVVAQFDAYTKQIDTLGAEIASIRERVRDVDIPGVQEGRMPQDPNAPKPSAAAQKRYGIVSGAGNELNSYASAELNIIKLEAIRLVKMVSKTGTIISKFLKQLEQVAKFINAELLK